jgi:hypothetical protein
MCTCVRLRAPTMQPSPSRARVGRSAGIHSQRTPQVQYMYTYIDVKPGVQMGTRVCSCIRVRLRAAADDTLIRGMWASAARSLRSAIHRWNTHRYSICIHTACMYLYPCAAGYTDERIADAGPPHTRAHVLRPSARIRADTCERFPSASTAGGSARRRSTMRGRSTRTSACGTPPRSPRWIRYAPPFPAGRRATAAGCARRGRRCGAGRGARQDHRCALACVCADVWARACAGAHVRRYSCA